MNKILKIFKRGIGMAEKLTKQEGIPGATICTTFQLYGALAHAVESK